jgi:hypothetical protein
MAIDTGVNSNKKNTLGTFTLVLARRGLFRRRQRANEIASALSLYGLVVAMILAELEVGCVESSGGLMSLVEPLLHPKMSFEIREIKIKFQMWVCTALCRLRNFSFLRMRAGCNNTHVT